jgi:hypothetical protein
MPSNFFFQKFIMAATIILDFFVYDPEPVLPFYLKCDNKYAIGKRCLDGDMDSVFFV